MCVQIPGKRFPEEDQAQGWTREAALLRAWTSCGWTLVMGREHGNISLVKRQRFRSGSSEIIWGLSWWSLFLPEKSHGQRSLVGYSPKGHKESDTTGRLSTGGPVVKNPPANAGDMGWPLVPEDPTCHGATKLLCHNCWSLCALESVLHTKRGHRNEKPTHHS